MPTAKDRLCSFGQRSKRSLLLGTQNQSATSCTARVARRCRDCCEGSDAPVHLHFDQHLPLRHDSPQPRLPLRLQPRHEQGCGASVAHCIPGRCCPKIRLRIACIFRTAGAYHPQPAHRFVVRRTLDACMNLIPPNLSTIAQRLHR